VRPWGFWDPVLKRIKQDGEEIESNNRFYWDMMNCVIGIIWQSSMIVLPVYFMIRDYPKALIALLVFLGTSLILKYTWLDNIRKMPD